MKDLIPYAVALIVQWLVCITIPEWRHRRDLRKRADAWYRWATELTKGNEERLAELKRKRRPSSL